MDTGLIAILGGGAAVVAILGGVFGALAGSYSRGKTDGENEAKIKALEVKVASAESALQAKLVTAETALQAKLANAEAKFAKHEEHMARTVERIERDFRSMDTVVTRLDAKLDAIQESVNEQRADMKALLQQQQQPGRRT